jgi:hypothetical protein
MDRHWNCRAACVSALGWIATTRAAGRGCGPKGCECGALGPARRPALHGDLESFLAAHNLARDGSTAINAEVIRFDAIHA